MPATYEDLFTRTNEMSTPDFSHLSKLHVRPDSTAKYTFYEIEGEPCLEVKPTTEINKGYLNAVLRKGRRTLMRMRNTKMSTDMLKQNRDQDRELYPEHVVVGWPTPPKDSDGKDVPFSKEACEAFLKALPDFLFDDLRIFCGSSSNFLVDENDLDDDSIEDLAGN